MGAVLRGIVPALATPLNADGSVDVGALRALVDHVIEGGVVGLFALSSTGEGPLLTDADRLRVMERAVDAAGRRAAVMCNVSDTSTARAIAWAGVAADAGADYAVATLPYYMRHNGSQITSFFGRLADASSLPLFVYNVPIYTKVPIPAATMGELAAHGNIVGVKDSTLDWRQFQRTILVKADHPDFCVLNGDEEALASTVFMGGDGGLLGLANVAPRLCVDLFEAADRGDIATARRLQAKVTGLQALWFLGECGQAGLKMALSFLGLGGRHVTHPLPPLGDEYQAKVRSLLKQAGVL